MGKLGKLKGIFGRLHPESLFRKHFLCRPRVSALPVADSVRGQPGVIGIEPQRSRYTCPVEGDFLKSNVSMRDLPRGPPPITHFFPVTSAVLNPIGFTIRLFVWAMFSRSTASISQSTWRLSTYAASSSGLNAVASRGGPLRHMAENRRRFKNSTTGMASNGEPAVTQASARGESSNMRG